MKKIVRILMILLLSISIFIYNPKEAFSQTTVAGQEMRNQCLVLAGITNTENLDMYITRAEFAKMIVKTSKFKDSTSAVSGTAVYNDVEKDSEYASYIKLASSNNYMVGYLGGQFKPNDFVAYKDVSRACLALLGYENSDFTGSQVEGRNQLFISLELNKNMNASPYDFVTKLDVINALYNTLKATPKSGGSIYGSLFNATLDANTKELDPSNMIKTSMSGPFIAKRGTTLAAYLPFNLDEGNYFLNGSASNYGNIASEISNTGFVILYFNETTKTCYAYRQGNSLDSTVVVSKGFVNNIYYNASDNLTPNSVEIELARYTLGNAEVKFAFSFAGTIKVNDQVIIVYETNSDSSSTYAGEITSVFLYDIK
ncbi:MAG: S-layer homology domain-containing protein [Eubacteriales bacterium]|nr:S-layer homology domain-containing protein [Eubacteriales bacterium]